MSNKITGEMITRFEFNTDTEEMVCKHFIQHDSTSLPIEIVMRAYISWGAQIHKAHQKARYGIKNEEDNKRVVERIHSELEEGETE